LITVASTNEFKSIINTRFGTVVIIWSVFEGAPRILRVLLSRPELSADKAVKSLFPDSDVSSCLEVDQVARQIIAFLRGEDMKFSLDVVRLDLCSIFQQRVLKAEFEIPRGMISTYQRIAGHLGDPRGARAVGTALAHNPFPIIVPCHRAIRSDGSLGGFQGGIEMKKALLEMEGVSFDRLNRVAPARIFY